MSRLRNLAIMGRAIVFFIISFMYYATYSLNKRLEWMDNAVDRPNQIFRDIKVTFGFFVVVCVVVGAALQ